MLGRYRRRHVRRETMFDFIHLRDLLALSLLSAAGMAWALTI